MEDLTHLLELLDDHPAKQSWRRKRLIYDLDLPELEARLKEIGQPAYRARQIWQGLYQKLWAFATGFQHAIERFAPATGATFRFFSPGTYGHSWIPKTRKLAKLCFVYRMEQAIEAVLMRYEKRRTLCISTQAGCAMGCVFCATGQMGFRRNLSSGEIVEQVLFYARELVCHWGDSNQHRYHGYGRAISQLRSHPGSHRSFEPSRGSQPGGATIYHLHSWLDPHDRALCQ